MGCLWTVEGIGSYGARLAKVVTGTSHDRKVTTRAINNFHEVI